MDRVAEDFEEHRPALLGLAYRLLGSMWDAEDVVQDAYVRWSRVDRDEVRDPRAYLVTVVSRLARDQLRSARADLRFREDGIHTVLTLDRSGGKKK